MTLAYFDCFSGISGDMTLGALVDAGVGIEALRTELGRLDLSGYEIVAEKLMRSGISATRVRVVVDEQDQTPRRLPDVLRIIEGSSLSSPVRKKSCRIFWRLADAEAKVHGTKPEQVHFHEIGAVDAIVDIVGSVIGLEILGITDVVGSPVNLGSGTVQTAHGPLPVPAPATAELLTGIPSFGSSVPMELTTPTGAAILSALASSFGPLPRMKSTIVAYGAGGTNLPGMPNVLRLMIGEPTSLYDEDDSTIIETNIDDMNPQIYGHLIEKLLQQGAQDAYLTPIIMKKGRPGVLLSVQADPRTADALLDTVFRETTSIGVRVQEAGRRKLRREVREIDTTYGKIRVKISKQGDQVMTVTPEYDDCRRIAEEKQVPLKTVMDEAKRSGIR